MKQTSFNRLVSKMHNLTTEQRLEIFELHLGLGTTDMLDSLIRTHEQAIDRAILSTSTYKASPEVIGKWSQLISILSQARSIFNS